MNISKPNKWTKKLVNFLQIKEVPSLRILSLQEYVRRYKFIGPFDIELVEFFIQNYLHNHLRPYRISQYIRKRKMGGIKVANYDHLVNAIKSPVFNSLFFVYSNLEGKEEVKRQVLELRKVKTLLQENNKDLRFFVMNGDKNDLDKHYHEDFPMLFLIQKGMKVKAF